jgi:hypothetical protein
MLGDQHNSVVSSLLVSNSVTHGIRCLVGPQALYGLLGNTKISYALRGSNSGPVVSVYTDRAIAAGPSAFSATQINIQGGSNMTGSCAACLHTDQSRSYLNHLVISKNWARPTLFQICYLCCFVVNCDVLCIVYV